MNIKLEEGSAMALQEQEQAQMVAELSLTREGIEALRDIVHATSTDTSREALTGVEIRFDGTELSAWATDTYVAVKRIVPFAGVISGEGFTIVLAGQALKASATAALKSMWQTAVFGISSDRAEIIHAAGTSIIPAIDVGFPNLPHVMLADFSGDVGNVSFALGQLNKIGKALGQKTTGGPKGGFAGNHVTGIVFEFQDSNLKPARVTASGHEDRGFGIIMPLRIAPVPA